MHLSALAATALLFPATISAWSVVLYPEAGCSAAYGETYLLSDGDTNAYKCTWPAGFDLDPSDRAYDARSFEVTDLGEGRDPPANCALRLATDENPKCGTNNPKTYKAFGHDVSGCNDLPTGNDRTGNWQYIYWECTNHIGG